MPRNESPVPTFELPGRAYHPKGKHALLLELVPMLARLADAFAHEPSQVARRGGVVRDDGGSCLVSFLFATRTSLRRTWSSRL